MMKKGEKGFTTVDISIAMIVVAMFVTIMSSVLYNVYLSSTEAKRTATALNYAVDIFETVGDKAISFSSITPEEVLTRIASELEMEEITSREESGEKIATGKIGTSKGAYNIKLTMTEPFTKDGIKPIKYFKLTITYNVAAKKEPETVALERIRVIEITEEGPTVWKIIKV